MRSSRGHTHLKQWEQLGQAPSQGTALSILAPSCHTFELCLWASVFYSHLFSSPISKMSFKVSEKPLRHFLGGLGMLKIFLYKLVVIASSLYSILAYERFHKKALFQITGETCNRIARFWNYRLMKDLTFFCKSENFFQLVKTATIVGLS